MITGSYNYPGIYGFPAVGSGQASVGRGPVDAFIVGGVTLSATLSASDGSTDVEIKALSGSVFSLSSSFTGSNWVTVFGPKDIGFWSNVAITLVNNHGTNNLESGSIEWSPNNVTYETDWDTKTFAGLTPGSIRSMQISSNSRRYLRVRVIPSGATGALTGSIDAYVHVNNG